MFSSVIDGPTIETYSSAGIILWLGRLNFYSNLSTRFLILISFKSCVFLKIFINFMIFNGCLFSSSNFLLLENIKLLKKLFDCLIFVLVFLCFPLIWNNIFIPYILHLDVSLYERYQNAPSMNSAHF